MPDPSVWPDDPGGGFPPPIDTVCGDYQAGYEDGRKAAWLVCCKKMWQKVLIFALIALLAGLFIGFAVGIFLGLEIGE